MLKNRNALILRSQHYIVAIRWIQLPGCNAKVHYSALNFLKMLRH